MTKPRSSLVSLADTPWYHVVNRCVRRAFLCGDDAVTGKNHDHRRAWIVDRVKQLAGVFAIDVAAYAVMSNHYHLVLRVDAERAQGWSNEEALRRWTQLFDGPLLVQRLLSGQGEEMDQATLNAIDEWAATYRARLCDLSWFMRVLNETVARQANTEDGVTGRFWEGRFKSQALHQQRPIEQLRPAAQRLFVAPALRPLGIDAQHQVIVVAHHRVSGHVDGEHPGQLFDPIHDPGPAMVVVLAGDRIIAAQKGTTHAAIHDVIPRRVGKGNERGTGLGHGASALSSGTERS
jgi:hypothetical protein